MGHSPDIFFGGTPVIRFFGGEYNLVYQLCPMTAAAAAAVPPPIMLLAGERQ
jgi:hypothetical protein